MASAGPRNSPFTPNFAILRYIQFHGYQTFASRITCEYSRFSLLLVASDVSPGGTSATQRQKFHTDDVKSVRNLFRSSDQSTQQLYCFTYCLRMTDKRPHRSNLRSNVFAGYFARCTGFLTDGSQKNRSLPHNLL